jgi:hypothetical protein
MTEPLADPPPISADLSPLFAPTGPGVRFGQGLITAWDATTGQNTIEWSGGTLTDVPILNTGEAIALRAGHVVGMLGQGLTWFIIGRVTPPNDPSFAGASLSFDAKNAQFTAFGLTTSLINDAFVTLNVPLWADEVAIMAVGSCTLVNTTGTADFASCAVFIDGVTGPGVQCGFAPIGDATVKNNHVGTMTASSTRVFPVVGGSTIQADLRIRSQTNSWGSSPTNIAEISAMAIFRSTV